MTTQFPHYRVISKQKKDNTACMMKSLSKAPYMLIILGLLLGFLVGICCGHNK